MPFKNPALRFEASRCFKIITAPTRLFVVILNLVASVKLINRPALNHKTVNPQFIKSFTLQ